MSTPTIRALLALIPIGGVVMCMGVLLFRPPPERELIHVLLGALIALSKDSFSYYFGASDPPAEKENG